LRELGCGARKAGSADRKHQPIYWFGESTDRLCKTADRKYTAARQLSKSECTRKRAWFEFADSANARGKYSALHCQPKYFHNSGHYSERLAVWNVAEHNSGHDERCVRGSEYKWLGPDAVNSRKLPRQWLDAARRSGDDPGAAQSLPPGSFAEWRCYAASIAVSNEL